MEAKAPKQLNDSDTMQNTSDSGTASESVQVSGETQACLDASQSRVQESSEYKATKRLHGLIELIHFQVYEGTPTAIDNNADLTDANTGVEVI